jgi:antirestriction protein ArdC
MPTVYEIVTQTIIEKLEAGEVPWRRPWITSAPKNLISGKEYRGIVAKSSSESEPVEA